MSSRVSEILGDLERHVRDLETELAEARALARVAAANSPDRMMTVLQVADLLAVSESQVRSLIRSGLLIALRVGEANTRIRRSDYDRYIEECRRSG